MAHWVDTVLVNAYGDICRVGLIGDHSGAGGTGENGADFYPVISPPPEVLLDEEKNLLLLLFFDIFK